MKDVAKIVEGLTEAQRVIMLGELADIPPDEADALKASGLKGEEFWDQSGELPRMIWPVTPLGLSVRSHLLAKDQNHDLSD